MARRPAASLARPAPVPHCRLDLFAVVPRLSRHPACGQRSASGEFLDVGAQWNRFRAQFYVAVRKSDRLRIKCDVFHAHAMLLPCVAHACIPHHDDDVPELLLDYFYLTKNCSSIDPRLLPRHAQCGIRPTRIVVVLFCFLRLRFASCADGRSRERESECLFRLFFTKRPSSFHVRMPATYVACGQALTMLNTFAKLYFLNFAIAVR